MNKDGIIMGNETKNIKNDHAVLKAVLKAFLPYSRENIMLSYKPGKFFNYLDYLEKQTKASRRSLSSTISRAKRNGLLKVDENGNTITSWRGKIKLSIKPTNKTRHLLIIVFDIPEISRKNRDLLRLYLKTTQCEQVQKSVWKTRYDIYDELTEIIEDLYISDYVNLFMADEVQI